MEICGECPVSLVSKVKPITSACVRNSNMSVVLLYCKVIRIGKRVQPTTSKARQQVNIDRPAYTKTDKQCRTRTTITARLPDD